MAERDDDRPRRSRDDDEDFEPRPAAPAGKSNAAGLTLSIIGLVFGTCALLFSFIPCLGYLALYPGIVATILSLIGLFVSTQAKALPITAAVVSVLSVGIAYWQGERAKKAGEEIKEDFKKGAKQLEQDAEKMRKQMEEDMKKAKQNNP